MMKLGLQIPSFTWLAGTLGLASTLARVGQAAEEAGFASLWVMDHFFQIELIGKQIIPVVANFAAG